MPSDRKDNGNEDLCNPAGRGTGPLSWDTGYKYVDGLLWFNNPGNSDGPCGAGDPRRRRVLARLRGRADPARDQRDPRPTREPDEVQHQHVESTCRRVSDGTRTGVLSGGRACISGVSDRCVGHLDMDAFYVSVELRRRPELRGRPVIVAGGGPRSVVTTASYEARRFGVGSAMPASQARRLCPRGVFLPPDFPYYRAASAEVMGIVRANVDTVEVVGLDEAYLESPVCRRRRPACAGSSPRSRSGRV